MSTTPENVRIKTHMPKKNKRRRKDYIDNLKRGEVERPLFKFTETLEKIFHFSDDDPCENIEVAYITPPPWYWSWKNVSELSKKLRGYWFNKLKLNR